VFWGDRLARQQGSSTHRQARLPDWSPPAANQAARRKEVGAVFESLDEQIKHDMKESTSPRERIFLWISVAVVSVLVFGGLYIGVRALD
jgi:hypothetical protein